MSIEIENLARSFRTADWISEFELRIPVSASIASGADIEFLLNNVKTHLEKRRSGRATNWLALALRLNGQETVRRIRRTGILRASKYDYDGKLLATVINPLVGRRATLNISDADFDYFQSGLALFQLATAVRELQHWIIRVLRNRQDVALKTLVVVADLRFIMLEKPDRYRSADDPKFHAAEEYAEGLSLLVHLFAKYVGIRDKHFNLLDEDGISSGDYDALLISACKIRAYNEAELLIDVFSFRASREGNTVRIVPEDIPLEQSIRLGYIQVQIQEAVRHVFGVREHGVEGRPSLSDLVRHVFEAHENTMLPQVTHPVPRIVLHMPDAPELFRPFREDHLYAEDVIYLETTANEQYCRPDKLLGFEVTNGLSLFDVLKIQRLMNFLGGLMAERLLPLIRANAPIAHRSLLPVFETGKFRELLGKCVNDEAAAAFIRCVEYRGSDREGMFDIQYRPVIRGQRYILVPMNILRNSNLMRNLLFLHAEKSKAEDPNSRYSMQQLLYAVMKTRFLHVAESVKLKAGGQHLEVDILAVVGRTLLVIECKSAFHPCNVHELRTSYDHVLKAADQLDRLKRVLQDKGVVGPLLRRLEWNNMEYDSVSGCVVTANRMFNGYTIRGNPVRQAYEMINIIQDGTITVGTDILRVWQSDEFSPEDLLRYLAGSTTHHDLFASMEPRDVTYPLGSDEMTFSTFILNGEHVMKLARSRYQVVGKRATGGAPAA